MQQVVCTASVTDAQVSLGAILCIKGFVKLFITVSATEGSDASKAAVR